MRCPVSPPWPLSIPRNRVNIEQRMKMQSLCLGSMRMDGPIPQGSLVWHSWSVASSRTQTRASKLTFSDSLFHPRPWPLPLFLRLDLDTLFFLSSVIFVRLPLPTFISSLWRIWDLMRFKSPDPCPSTYLRVDVFSESPPVVCGCWLLQASKSCCEIFRNFVILDIITR